MKDGSRTDLNPDDERISNELVQLCNILAHAM
jgi:hypothetical protein